MDCIYLDNSATTPLSDVAKGALIEGAECFGNPSSLHARGMEALSLQKKARASLLKALGLRPTPAPSHRVIFTSCGTESNNMAIFGVINAKNFKFLPEIITTNSEHPSVLNALDRLEKEGRAKVHCLSTSGGKIQPEELSALVNEHTVLVSIMWVNNETGAIYDIKKLFDTAKKKNPNIITHSDMTQGFLKLPARQNPISMGADMMTVSGHKIHAPKGIAVLAIRESLITAKRVVPLMEGGGQEKGLRSGTENMPGICALGAACEEGLSSLQKDYEKMSALSELFISRLPESIKINRPESRAPHIISITLPSIKSESALNHLSSLGVYVSSGSACSSHGGHKSYVLNAFGLTPEESDCTLRISLSRYTSKEELQDAAEKISLTCQKLVRI